MRCRRYIGFTHETVGPIFQGDRKGRFSGKLQHPASKMHFLMLRTAAWYNGR